MRVIAIGSINSGQYDKGDVFDLGPKDAEHLKASGAVRFPKGGEKVSEVTPPNDRGSEDLAKKSREAKKSKGGKKKQ